MITRIIPNPDNVSLPTVKYILSWYNKKEGTIEKSIEINNGLKLYIKECERPLVYLLDNSKTMENMSFVLKLKIEAAENMEWVNVKPHKLSAKNGDEESSDEEDDEDENESDDEEEDDDEEEEDESDDEETSSEEDAPQNNLRSNNKGIFNSTFSNLVSASSKLVSSLKTSKLLGIHYYSFVMIVPGESKEIVLRSKRIDQVIVWMNTLATVSLIHSM